MGRGNKNVFKWSRIHDQCGHHAHIWLKPYKNLHLSNRKADDIVSWYAALGTQVLPNLFKSDPGLTLTYFAAMSSVVSYAFVWERVKQCIF